MQSSRAEKLFAAVLTFLTVGSVVSLTYFLLASNTSYPTTIDMERSQPNR